jgi:hypothetical protein
MSSTGIAVFAYNRPDHLERVLAGLRENELDHLYVFADGPSSKRDRPKVESVREMISNIEWAKTTVVTRENNIGLANSVISGINHVFETHDRIIVLEDDCVPSPKFISFMEYCLNKYEDDDKVMNINGYSPPIDIPDDYPYDIYFTYRSSSWGWATWKSAWETYERSPLTLSEFKRNKRSVRDTVKNAGYDLLPMMEKQLRGEIDSWAVWWSYAIASENGLCVNPTKSYIKNIGHDGTGTNSGDVNKYDVSVSSTDPESLSFPDQIVATNTINKRYRRHINGDQKARIKRHLANVLKSMGLWNLYQRLSK